MFFSNQFSSVVRYVASGC